MRRFWPLFLFVIIFVVALVGVQSQSSLQQIKSDSPQRIISLAPSITETLFALGLDDNVVAVTDYCDYPDAANELPKIGGFTDPNIEKIIALQPDLVVLLANQDRTVEQLKQLNISTLTVRNSNITEIKHTIKIIGDHTQHQAQSQKLLDEIQKKIENISEKTKQLARPTVMIAMGHSIGSEHFKQVYISGQHDFYNDLITLAGGQNVYQQQQPQVPSLSVEGIMQLNPHVIFDIFPEADDHNTDLTKTLQQWMSLKYVDAVQHKRVHIIEESYATIPGPRIFLLLDQLAKQIHPELNWEQSTP